MNPEKKILVFIDWYLPGYKAGGPIQSCANLVAHLKNDFDIRVVTGNTDLNETIPYPGIQSNTWNELENGTRVFYFSAASKNYSNIKSLLVHEKFDILYLNSFFSVPFTLIPLVAVRMNKIKCKVIIAPRGMMGKGSLGIKPLKKKIFIMAVKATGLFKYVTWHASTPNEKNEITDIFGKQANIRNAINLTAPRKIVRKERKKQKGAVRFFCLARISPVKNILAIFRYLQQADAGSEFLLDLYGTMEDQDYIDKCMEIAKGYGPNITVNFKGPVENKYVAEICLAYHFMILPTHNENFGHAIAESLMAGCPVIISNCTPWRELEKIKAGWDLPLDNDRLFTDKINICTSMDQQEYNIWSNGAYDLAEKIVKNEEGVKQNKELFLS